MRRPAEFQLPHLEEARGCQTQIQFSTLFPAVKAPTSALQLPKGQFKNSRQALTLRLDRSSPH